MLSWIINTVHKAITIENCDTGVKNRPGNRKKYINRLMYLCVSVIMIQLYHIIIDQHKYICILIFVYV